MNDRLERRKGSWYRAGPLVAAGGLALLAAGGCGDDAPADMGSPSDMAMSMKDDGGGGGGDLAGGPDGMMMAGTFSAEPSTTSGMYSRPQDSVPSPDGTTFYFTAMGMNGPGIFKVPAAGGAATEIFSGDPLVAPFGIAVSGDGAQLVITDPGAATADEAKRGALFTLAPGGGTPANLGASLEGTRPRGLDIRKVKGASAEEIWFTGIDPSDGKAALLKTGLNGGGLTVVAKGDAIVDPSGVAVTEAGEAYVVDTIGGEGGRARVIKVSGGQASVFLDGIEVGYPAGIALSMDDTWFFVSGIGPSGRSVVFQVEVASKKVTLQDKTIGENTDSGGLHRAHTKNLFSWCGVTAGSGGGGIVYRVEFK